MTHFDFIGNFNFFNWYRWGFL